MHNCPRVAFQNYLALRHFLSSEATNRFVSLTQCRELEYASLEGAEGVMVKWNARRIQRTMVRPFSQILIHTNSGTLLSSTNRKLDAKKDFEVSQGQLGDRFSRS